MRLTDSEANAIREEVSRSDPEAELYLFGSRTDDTARGGDIDLLVVSDKLTFRNILSLRVRILDRIGEQKLDLETRRKNEMDTFAMMAKETGIKL